MAYLEEHQVSSLRKYASARLRIAEGKLQQMNLKSNRSSKAKTTLESEIKQFQSINNRITKYYSAMLWVNYEITLGARHTPSGLLKTFKAKGIRQLMSSLDYQARFVQEQYDFIEGELSRIDGNSFNSGEYPDPHGLSQFSKMFLGMIDDYTIDQVSVDGIPRSFTFTESLSPLVPTDNTSSTAQWDGAVLSKLLKRIRIDSVESPTIGGYRSVESGPFGCCVSFLSLYSSQTPKVIFDRLCDQYAFEYEFNFDTLQQQMPDEIIGEMHLDTNMPNHPGFNVYDLERYVKQYDLDNVYHISFVNGNKVSLNQERFNNTHRPRSAINLLVHNNHIYIPDESSPGNKKKTVKVQKFDEIIQLETGEVSPNNKLFSLHDRTTLVDFGENNPIDFISYCAYEKNFLPVVKMRQGGISEIIVNSHNILVGERVEMRRSFLNRLALEYPDSTSFKSFNNQSWTQIACAMADLSIDINQYRSYDSMYDREILQQFKTAHVMGLYESIESTFSIDLKGCYLSIMLESGNHNIGCFASTDNFIAFNGTQIYQTCEYICDAFTYMNIPVKAQCWNGNSVQKLLELGAIDSSKIFKVRRPSRQVSLAKVVNMFKSWNQKYPDVLKYLYTQWIGYCGISEDKSYNSYLTNDSDAYHGRADSTTGHELVNTYRATRPIYLLCETKSTQQLHNLNPLYRYVISAGIVKLLELARLSNEHGYKTIATRVDCVYLTPDASRSQHTPRYMLDKVIEKFARTQTKKCGLTTIAAASPTYSNIMDSKNALDTINPAARTGYCINGPAGSGKTTELIRMANLQPKNTILCMANMRKVVAVLKKKIYDQTYCNFAELETSQQWATDFSIVRQYQYQSSFYKSIVKNTKVIMIDEFSMMGSREYNTLHRLCMDIYRAHNQYPQVIMVGDCLQINPVKQATINIRALIDRQVFPYLTEWRELKYLTESGRYNYYPVVEEFLKTRKLPEAFCNRIYTADDMRTMPLKHNIAAHNKIRYQIIQEKQAILPDDLVIVVRSSKRKGASSGEAAAKGYDNGEIIKRQEATDRSIPAIDYESAFCFTAHKAQGATFEFDYGIYELESMSFQQAYVSLTRGRTLEQMFIAGDIETLRNKTFELADYNESPEAYARLAFIPEEITQCPIYLYRNDVDKSIYLGKTIRTIEERALEHAESSRALNPDQAWSPELFTCIATCQVQDQLTIEANLIREHCAYLADPMHELYGYKILNVHHVIQFQTVAREPAPDQAWSPEMQNTGDLSPLERFYARQVALDILKIDITEEIHQETPFYKCKIDRTSMRFTLKSKDKSEAALLVLIEKVSNKIRVHYPTF